MKYALHFIGQAFHRARTPANGVNVHPQSGWLEFSAIGRKAKSTSVLQSVHLQPGAEHTVCMARNQGKSGRIAEVYKKFLNGLAKMIKKTGLPYNQGNPAIS